MNLLHQLFIHYKLQINISSSSLSGTYFNFTLSAKKSSSYLAFRSYSGSEYYSKIFDIGWSGYVANKNKQANFMSTLHFFCGEKP